MNDSFLFDLVPPLWLDFVPTGTKERQGEGTFARGQRVKFRAPLQLRVVVWNMGGTARAPFNLPSTFKCGAIRRVKGCQVSLLPLWHGKIKTFTPKINGVGQCAGGIEVGMYGPFKRMCRLVVRW